jgi:2',3'-cyclic-nucleotide 2'-phosphodiesterase (5'-nucleotidase family)
MFDPDSSWTRRDFVKLIGRAGLISAVPNLAHAAATLRSDVVCISILHTTDLHGHILPTSDYDEKPDRGGLARCVTQIRQWRCQNPNSILIDVGDVYQGTDVGLRTKGDLMIDLFNYLEYDAWVVGNHEFDWGIEPFERALERSTMPVLAANTLLHGKPTGEFLDTKHPLAKLQPFMLKEIAGIKLAIIGVTTPGMAFWFRPEFARGIDFQYPVEPVRRAIASAKSEGADAVVLTGHMGLKPRSGGDDFANTVMALTSGISGDGGIYRRSYPSNYSESHHKWRTLHASGPLRHSCGPCRSSLRSQFQEAAASGSSLRVHGQPFKFGSRSYFASEIPTR